MPLKAPAEVVEAALRTAPFHEAAAAYHVLDQLKAAGYSLVLTAELESVMKELNELPKRTANTILSSLGIKP